MKLRANGGEIIVVDNAPSDDRTAQLVAGYPARYVCEDRVGLNWRVPVIRGKRTVRHVIFDTNYWKSFIQARLAVPMGDRGCLSLFGSEAVTHRLFAEHITAEYRVKTEGRGRTFTATGGPALTPRPGVIRGIWRVLEGAPGERFVGALAVAPRP